MGEFKYVTDFPPMSLVLCRKAVTVADRSQPTGVTAWCHVQEGDTLIFLGMPEPVRVMDMIEGWCLFLSPMGVVGLWSTDPQCDDLELVEVSDG